MVNTISSMLTTGSTEEEIADAIGEYCTSVRYGDDYIYLCERLLSSYLKLIIHHCEKGMATDDNCLSIGICIPMYVWPTMKDGTKNK